MKFLIEISDDSYFHNENILRVTVGYKQRFRSKEQIRCAIKNIGRRSFFFFSIASVKSCKEILRSHQIIVGDESFFSWLPTRIRTECAESDSPNDNSIYATCEQKNKINILRTRRHARLVSHFRIVPLFRAIYYRGAHTNIILAQSTLTALSCFPI